MSSSDVVILFGGSSSERLVSVASAQNVSRLLPDAACWFLSPAGAVHPVSADELAAHQRPFEAEFEPRQAARFASIDDALATPESKQLVFFLALHGGEGENGALQARFERAGVAFTGSGSAASARAFDKAVTKALVGAKGARLATARVVEATSDVRALEATLAALFDDAPRWVLKPVSDGSSTGLVHLTSKEKVPQAAGTLAALKLRYLAEAFVAGRELTVGVVDGPDGPVALPVSEVRTVPGGAFDYAGKYLGKGTEELTPAPITDTEREAAQALGLLAHEAVGCTGYSRTDMILTPDGPVFLEINTLPGLTKASFIPQQLAAAGQDLRAFLVSQVQLGRARTASVTAPG
ncbi:MAG: ATP-grasp domain-containing protein [Myxococcaceae bacterium]|nr:ATP-grasp domain-containing protein [Myxococcaceae bacterium]